ncbi:MAG: isoprenylcysteine carboxylmethyltransferase family protein [Acidobacteria bacterium]|nr:MAG: isoprenylcysteine carboxylmethyltransferase family protein [Acidobacteriota bacterium]
MDKSYAAWAARWRVPLGFALGVAFLVWSRPGMLLLVAGGLVALVGLLVRGAAAGYLEKGRTLATAGPYRFTRNPLYLGSFIIGAGLAVAGGSWPLAGAFLALYIAVYAPVMQREQATLGSQFGERFERYASSVPLFFPSLSKRGTGLAVHEGFRWERYRKNREYEAALGYALVMLFLAVKMLLS